MRRVLSPESHGIYGPRGPLSLPLFRPVCATSVDPLCLALLYTVLRMQLPALHCTGS